MVRISVHCCKQSEALRRGACLSPKRLNQEKLVQTQMSLRAPWPGQFMQASRVELAGGGDNGLVLLGEVG
jgi:hypothetical protein